MLLIITTNKKIVIIYLTKLILALASNRKIQAVCHGFDSACSSNRIVLMDFSCVIRRYA